ncbi:MAG: hypothetical protein ACRDCE_19540 [Cetobacterium sp.]|uniref:ParE family toxin-like protein n=1 Tax=Cetobacterium sp. TaxID=2071632 RepID=UPI003EE4EEC3
MELCFAKGLQTKDKNKAIIVFNQYLNKEIHARKMNNRLYTTLSVGRSIRIVIREHKAEVMTHEAYNKFEMRVR